MSDGQGKTTSPNEAALGICMSDKSGRRLLNVRMVGFSELERRKIASLSIEKHVPSAVQLEHELEHKAANVLSQAS